MLANMEVLQMGVDTVTWCNQQLEKAIQEGRKQEADAYARLKDLWEDRSNGKSKESDNG